MLNRTYTFKFVVKTLDNSDSIRFIVRFAGSDFYHTLPEYIRLLTPRQYARWKSFALRNVSNELSFYTLWSRVDD